MKGGIVGLTFADLRFRARQFVITVVGVALVLAMGLELTGLAAGFRTEVVDTVDGVGATTWVMAKAADGAVGSFTGLPDAEAKAVAAEPGGGRTDPLLLVGGQQARIGTSVVQVVLMGVRPGGLGSPQVVSGRPLSGRGQIVADSRLHLTVGQRITIGGRSFRVVGTVDNRTIFGGFAIVFTSLRDAQAVTIGGRPLSSALVTTARPRSLPAGLVAKTPAQVVDATAARLASAQSSIQSARVLMWVIAVFIVAALLYVSALDRQRDFAVLKALGASSATLLGSLVIQAVVVTLLASLIADATGNFLAPMFSQPVDTPLSAYLTLPLVAVAVGIVASTVAVRKATSADPAAAFS